MNESAPIRPAKTPDQGSSKAAASQNASGGEQGGLDVAGTLERVRTYPLASTLITSAAAWLAYEAATRKLPHGLYELTREALGSTGEKLSRAAAFAKDEAGVAAEAASRAGTTAGGAVRRGAAGLVGSVKNGAAAVANTAGRGVATGRDAAGELWESHPLAVSVGLLATGVALGMLLPVTSQERLLAGAHSARLRMLAREAGGELIGRSKRIATNAIRDGAAVAVEEAERVGLTPDRVVRKVKRIAQRIGDTVSHATDED